MIDRRALVWFLLFAAVAALPAKGDEPTSPGGPPAAAAARINPHAGLLREMGITPDAAGIAAYLDGLEPDADQRRRIEALIADLGDAEFQVRETATAALLTMPAVPLERLREAEDADDAEIAWRARQIVQQARGKSTQVLFAVLATIHRDRLGGLAPRVLRAVSHCDRDYMVDAAVRALTVTSGADDDAVLRQALESDDGRARRAAAAALGSIYGTDGADDTAALLESADGWVQFESARALLDVGDRRSLPALASLLDAEELRLRALAASALRAATRKSFGFAAYDAPDARREKAAQWKDWVQEHGETVELHFPLRETGAAEVGRTLIALYTEHRVIEVDERGRQLREIKGHQGPWGAQRLANGNLLINWFSSHLVVEYAPDGSEVWRKAGLNYPWSAQRLANGNTLISCNNRVIEVTPGGEIAWEKVITEHLADARRLANGNTLILVMDHGGPGRAVEVDPGGEVVWEIDGLEQPYRVQRLDNGNTLITLKRGNRVVEYDPDGETIVWKLDGLTSPDSAQRLANGNTLVSDAAGVREFDPSGEVVWEKKLTSNRSISSRY